MTVAHFYTVKQNRQKYTKYKIRDIKHKAWNLQCAARKKQVIVRELHILGSEGRRITATKPQQLLLSQNTNILAGETKSLSDFVQLQTTKWSEKQVVGNRGAGCIETAPSGDARAAYDNVNGALTVFSMWLLNTRFQSHSSLILSVHWTWFLKMNFVYTTRPTRTEDSLPCNQ